MTPLVLCYHAVSDVWGHQLAVPRATVERQVERLVRRGYRGVAGAEVLTARGRRLHVTFDDAFRNVLAALPALRRLDVPVTVFACPAYADSGGPFDVPELASEAAAHPDELATLDWDALRALAQSGVGVGSHTSSHPHLTQLGDRELRFELESSRRRIEDELGRPCALLAYPYGDQDARVRRAARSAGYRVAFALPGRLGTIDSHAFPRVGVYGKDTTLRLTLKTQPSIRRVAARLRH